MIKIDSDYYYSCPDGAESQQSVMEQNKDQVVKQSSEKVLETVGDVKEYLTSVSLKIKEIKIMREQQKKELFENKLIMGKLSTLDYQQTNSQQSVVQFQISVPEQIYLLEQKLSQIEAKFNHNEIFRQKIQRKGKLAERVKFLNSKIQVLSQKSPDILISNIQSYYQNLEEKNQNMKALFLYETSSNTKGLSEEIQVLTAYLHNLKAIQFKLQGMPPKVKAIQNHEKILLRRKQTSQRIQKLYEHMKSQYEKIIREIDSL